MPTTILCVTECPDAASLVEYRDYVRDISAKTNVEHKIDVVKNFDLSYTVTVSAESSEVENDDYVIDLAYAIADIEARIYHETHPFTEAENFIIK